MATSLLGSVTSCGDRQAQNASGNPSTTRFGDFRGNETGFTASQVSARNSDDGEWDEIRAQFDLDPDYIHMAGLLIASHPRPVQEAIARYRQGLDRNPAVFVEENNRNLQAEARRAAADYLGAQEREVALTDSTTMGTALIINGLQIRENQEMLTARYDYYSTHEAMRYKANRTGASIQEIPLYDNIETVSEEEIVDNLLRAVNSRTRLVTSTWVHSSTGLKVPIRQIADRLAELNAGRAEGDRALLFVDGVHGLGVEDDSISDLGCDFFAAGTHKWMFAPRGTGIIWGNPRSQAFVTPTIPTFTRGAGWGGRMSPGGFKPFEHQWAMVEAFRFHQQMGKSQVTERIHSLSQHLKEGLANMPHVRLYTPMSQRLSAGIVCFDVDGFSPVQVVEQLQQRGIVASDTPYSPSHARLTPGVYNTPGEVEQVLAAVHDLR